MKRNYYRRSYGRNNGKFSKPQRKKGQNIDVSLYIHKSTQAESVTDIPQIHFSNLKINSQIRNNILQCGFEYLTPIQSKAIEPILEQKDVIGIAHTGTGKTAAFLIPLLHLIAADKSKRVLILTPTRELAQQISEKFRLFSAKMNIYGVTITGGASIRDQIQNLRKNPNFVIGTPGRLKDLIQQNILDLKIFNTIVLDEVDRMLDMGFIQDIRYLISLLPQKKQSLFFSATLSSNINRLIQEISHNPVSISVKSENKTANIEQDVIRVEGNQKIELLHDLLIKKEVQKTLIFGRTKRGVDRLSKELYSRGFKVAAIHGDKSQSRRNKAIELFKNNRVEIMVATDVASRGIDIEDITHVINYDQPETYEDYIHRIGRTGRANKKGMALTFID